MGLGLLMPKILGWPLFSNAWVCTLLLLSFNIVFSGPGAGNSLGKAIMGSEYVNEQRMEQNGTTWYTEKHYTVRSSKAIGLLLII